MSGDWSADDIAAYESGWEYLPPERFGLIGAVNAQLLDGDDLSGDYLRPIDERRWHHVVAAALIDQARALGLRDGE